MATGGSSCLLRCSSTSKDLVVVFELAMTVVKIDDEDATPVEVSCGWSELALFASSADTYIEKGSYERLVYGGNLCEKVPIDGSDPDPVPTGKSSFFGKKKTIKPQAKLNLELKDPGKSLVSAVDQLPGTLLVREQLIPLIVLYRQTLASTLHQAQQIGNVNTEPLCDPFLAGFPALLDMPILAAHFKTRWDAHQKDKANKGMMKDPTKKRAQFERVFLKDAWPVTNSAPPPPSIHFVFG